MRWLKKFKHLWRVEVRDPPTFEELESKASKTLEEDYEEKKNTEIEDAFSTLEGDNTPLEEALVNSAPDYDVGEVTVDDLLEEKNLESHYELNIVDAEIEGSDEHLIGVKQVEP